MNHEKTELLVLVSNTLREVGFPSIQFVKLVFKILGVYFGYD